MHTKNDDPKILYVVSLFYLFSILNFFLNNSGKLYLKMPEEAKSGPWTEKYKNHKTNVNYNKLN